MTDFFFSPILIDQSILYRFLWVCARTLVCVLSCFLIHSYPDCVYPTTTLLAILNKFIHLKREKKKKCCLKNVFSCCSKYFAWWDSRVTLLKFISEVVINHGKCQSYWTFVWKKKNKNTRCQDVKDNLLAFFFFLTQKCTWGRGSPVYQANTLWGMRIQPV